MAEGDEAPRVQLLTAKQVARRLTVSERTLERMIEDGTFPGPRWLGGQRRWPESQVEVFLRRLELGEVAIEKPAGRPRRASHKKPESPPEGPNRTTKGDKP